eukprot:2107615-Pleurochrysis_carterae.AAC.2
MKRSEVDSCGVQGGRSAHTIGRAVADAGHAVPNVSWGWVGLKEKVLGRGGEEFRVEERGLGGGKSKGRGLVASLQGTMWTQRKQKDGISEYPLEASAQVDSCRGYAVVARTWDTGIYVPHKTRRCLSLIC